MKASVHGSCGRRPAALVVLALLLGSLSTCGSARAALLEANSVRAGGSPRRVTPPMSSAGAALCATVREAGGMRSNPWVTAAVERVRRSEFAVEAASEAAAPSRAHVPLGELADVTSMGVDQLATFDPPGCVCSTRGPYLSEAETSVAMWGRFVLGSWNDNRSRCYPQTGSQGWGYSVNGGRTWVDKRTIPAGPGPTDYFHGDPIVSVNEKLGRFYVAGIHRTGSAFTGIIALRGHFVADTFQTDQRVIVALAQGDDFLDKPWMVADSVSGNVYITWTNFRADNSIAVELQRLDADLQPLGPLQVLEQTDALVWGPQGTFPAVGPLGELYVPWTEYTIPFSGNLARVVVRKSVDFGQTFEPGVVVSQTECDYFNGGPGSLRSFGTQNVSMSVDRSNGPHRGRAYLAWEEAAFYQDAPFGATTAAFDNPADSTFANATPFVPGGKLRGSLVAGEKDLFRFDGAAGQTFVMRPDTTIDVYGSLRVICSSDLGSLATWHVLTYGGISSNGVVLGLPYTGTYYVVLENPNLSGPIGTYALSTAWDTPTPGEVAHDQRDIVVTHSDDGLAWSPAQRMDDAPTGFDATFPTLAVDGRGHVHAAWLDWREDPGCGDLSGVYSTISADGGASWAPNRRVSDHASYWGPLASCSSANHGDYMQIAASGDRRVAAFPDSRLGTPDVWVDGVRTAAETFCPGGGTVLTGGAWTASFSVSNMGSFDTPRAWSLSDSRGWLVDADPAIAGQQVVAAGGGVLTVTATLHGPIGCGGDSTTLRFVSSDPYVAGGADTCAVTVRCRNSADAPPGAAYAFALAPPAPNPGSGPVRLRYSLARPGFVRIEVLDLRGARMRTLVNGWREAGPAESTWDGTDGDGRSLPAGVYWVRLTTEGHTLRRSLLRRP